MTIDTTYMPATVRDGLARYTSTYGPLTRHAPQAPGFCHRKNVRKGMCGGGILDRQKYIYRGTKFVSPRDIGE